jgi:hypothetical protein
MLASFNNVLNLSRLTGGGGNWWETDPNLLGYWPFTANADDAGPNSLDGTLAFEAFVGGSPVALQLDGSGDRCTIEGSNSFFGTLTTGSISAWVKPSNNGIIFATRSDRSNNRQFNMNGACAISAVNSSGTIIYVATQSTVNLQDGSYHLLTYSSEDGSGSFSVYVDGVDITNDYSFVLGSKTDFFFGDAMNETTDVIMFGAKSDSSAVYLGFLNGSVGRIPILSRTITLAEHTQLYNAYKSYYGVA